MVLVWLLVWFVGLAWLIVGGFSRDCWVFGVWVWLGVVGFRWLLGGGGLGVAVWCLVVGDCGDFCIL